jgi:hypothetical protein
VISLRPHHERPDYTTIDKLTRLDERSDKGHWLYMGCVQAAFDTLPEWERGRWATSDELRAAQMVGMCLPFGEADVRIITTALIE